MAAVTVPVAPGFACLAKFNSFSLAQLVPFQDSVFATGELDGGCPPIAKAEVLLVPAPAINIF